MVLEKDERLVKEWVYGEGIGVNYSLAVTNKRVVSIEKTPMRNKRDEVLLRDIQGVSVSHQTPSMSVDKVLMLIFGPILMLFSLCLFVGMTDVKDDSLAMLLAGAGIIAFGMGLFLLIKGLTSNIRQGAFSLVITVRGNQSIGLVLGVIRLPNKNAGTVINVKINNDIAEEIIETIGSLILTDNN